MNHKVKHIAIIMDGNRRWAENNNFDLSHGHKEGAKNAKKIALHAAKIGISYITLYAFSSENWNRPQKEVDNLIDLLNFYLENEIENFKKADIKFRMIGNKTGLQEHTINSINKFEQETKNNKGLTFNLAINYGAHDEILRAIKLAYSELGDEIRNLKHLENYLDSYDNNLKIQQPYPDILIRTGGEKRISNFLLWQIAYTELFFEDKLWPDFTEIDLDNIIKLFHKRERRYGKRN